MSFAQELQTIYKVKKAELLENKDEIQERRAGDITLFFEKEVREHAKSKMLQRAEAGRPTANILEYEYNERFFVDENKHLIRYVSQECNYPNYRIHDIVSRDTVFQTLLKNFETELSTEDTKIYFSCWRPRGTLNVIEAIWGRNRYHNVQPPLYEDSDGFMMTGESNYQGGRGGGRGRGGRGRGRGGGGGGGRGRGGRGDHVVNNTEDAMMLD